MAARVQVIVETKDASSGVLRGITSQFGALGSLVEDLTAKNVNWGNVAQTATTLVINGLKDSYEEAQRYSQSVRDLSLITQTGAEETSRFIQVLDDYQLTSEDAEAATRKLKDNGLVPTIDTLATLADKYKEIKDPAERMAFIQDNLGRGGVKWINVLNQTGDALRAQAGAISDNLILTDQEVANMEKARLAQDAWSDAIKGMQVQVGLTGGTIVIAYQQQAKAIDAAAAAYLGGKIGLMEYLRAAREATQGIEASSAVLEKYQNAFTDVNAVMQDYIAGEHEAANATEELSTAVQATDYKSLISSIQNTQQEMDKYHEKNVEVAQSEQELIQKKQALLGAITTLKNQGYSEMSDAVQKARADVKDVDAELAANKKQLSDNAAEHKKWAAQVLFSFAQARAAADGEITEGEGEVLIAAGEALGLFDKQTADAMESVNKSFDDLDTSNAKQVIADLKAQLLLLTSQPYYVDIVTRVTGGGIPDGSTGVLCFVEDTKITTGYGANKSIQDIKVGDEVMSYDLEYKAQIFTRVQEVFVHDAEEYLLINGLLGVTAEHPMYVNGDWVKAGDIVIDDELFTSNGSSVTVRTIERVVKSVKVYNFEVDGEAHNYFAGGYLVHNKTQQGGQVQAGVPTLVGEMGAEPFIPAVNGRILSHAESLHAMTIGSQGGGNGTNYFYGNVTLQIGEDDAAGLLSLR